MMKSLALFGLLSLLWCPLAFPQVQSVMGVAVQPPTQAVGACASGHSRTMVYRGTTNTVGLDAPTISSFRVAENEGLGRGYALTSDTGIGRTWVVNFDLSAPLPTQTTQAAINTANSPDASTQIRAVLYDSNFYLFGFQQTAPCNVTACLHLRSFTGVTTLVNLTATVPVSSGFLVAIRDNTSNTYWAAYTSTLGGGSIVKTTAGGLVLGSTATTVNASVDLSSDGGSIYSTFVLGGLAAVRKVDIASLAASNFSFVSTTAVGGTTFYNGVLYVGMTGAASPRLNTVNTSTGAITGTLLLGAAETVIAGGLHGDPFNNKLYVVTQDGATGTNIRRVNPTTLAVEQTLAVGLLPQAQGVGFDFPRQVMYFTTSASSLLQLSKVTLCN